MKSKKLTYLPGILIAAIGVAVQAFDFNGFDFSETHEPKSYAANDVRADENRVNEMAVILNRLEGVSASPRDPFAVGMEAFGAISAVAQGKDISEGVDMMKDVDPISFVNSMATDPKTIKFHSDLSAALKANGQPNLNNESNQIDQLAR